jgi:hypothetical protein
LSQVHLDEFPVLLILAGYDLIKVVVFIRFVFLFFL